MTANMHQFIELALLLETESRELRERARRAVLAEEITSRAFLHLQGLYVREAYHPSSVPEGGL